MPDEADPRIGNAVSAFWSGRRSQTERQQLTGRVDAGARGAVTGGGHLDAVRNLLASIFVEAGFPESSIGTTSRIVLPGYYRPSKKWDLTVVLEGKLAAAVELKSQVGPSFGNNYNNRCEEAIGNAVDFRRAYDSGAFGDLGPWVGYVMLLEHAERSTSPVSAGRSEFLIDPAFTGASYAGRYVQLCERLVNDGLYDAAWFITATTDGVHSEPAESISLARFTAAVGARAAALGLAPTMRSRPSRDV